MSFWGTTKAAGRTGFGSDQTLVHAEKSVEELASTVLVIDQMDDMYKVVVNWLDACNEMLSLAALMEREPRLAKALFDGVEGTEAKLDGLRKKTAFLNRMVGGVLTAFNLTASDLHDKRSSDDIFLAKKRLGVFKEQLDRKVAELSESDERVFKELSSRVAPVLRMIMAMLDNKPVPMMPPPKLTAEMFTEETVASAMGSFLGGAHKITDAIEEVKSRPRVYDQSIARLRDGKAGLKGLAAMSGDDETAPEYTSILVDADQSKLDWTKSKSKSRSSASSKGCSHPEDDDMVHI
jgi:hypothetical protein